MNRVTIEEAPPSASPGAGQSDGRDARWDGHRNRKREDLIRSARRSIHRAGPGVSMDRIAAEAGTSKSVIYRYFGGKDGLRAAIGEDVVRGLREGVVTAGRDADDPRTGLRGMILAYLSQAQASPNTYAFVLGADGAAAAASVDAITEELVSFMADRLAQLAPEGSAAATPSSTLWPSAAIGLIRAAGERWLADPQAGEDACALADTLTNWLLVGLTTPAADTPTAADADGHVDPVGKDHR